MSQIHPLGDRVVIEHIEAADQSKGGVHIPETAKERPQEGWIIALGYDVATGYPPSTDSPSIAELCSQKMRQS